jgi:hypothetical protein
MDGFELDVYAIDPEDGDESDPIAIVRDNILMYWAESNPPRAGRDPYLPR